uniref:Cadherin domain-containing protein n=1 Tax=Magallana gigas TaxID=29159 RepID=A0A8W8LD50_MAGGI
IFIYPDCEQQCASTQFRISTTRTKRGQLVVSPIELKAIDQDSLNFSVTYSIEPDQNNYHDSFKIDNITASISQIGDINHTGIILVKATEKSAKRHYTTAVVLVELPNDPLNKPERSTDEGNDNGTLIGIIVLAIVSAALISVVVVLVILHRKLKKNVAPFDGNSSVIKVLDEKGQKSSEINEVKPIPRSHTISQEIEPPDNVRQENVKDIKEYDEETDHNLEMQNGNLLNALSTTSEKNNTLDPIQPNSTPKKKKKKKKKKSKSLSERLGKKNRSGISEVGQGNNEDERTQSSREGRTLDLQNTEIAAIDGEFV